MKFQAQKGDEDALGLLRSRGGGVDPPVETKAEDRKTIELAIKADSAAKRLELAGLAGVDKKTRTGLASVTKMQEAIKLMAAGGVFKADPEDLSFTINNHGVILYTLKGSNDKIRDIGGKIIFPPNNDLYSRLAQQYAKLRLGPISIKDGAVITAGKRPAKSHEADLSR